MTVWERSRFVPQVRSIRSPRGVDPCSSSTIIIRMAACTWPTRSCPLPPASTWSPKRGMYGSGRSEWITRFGGQAGSHWPGASWRPLCWPRSLCSGSAPVKCTVENYTGSGACRVANQVAPQETRAQGQTSDGRAAKRVNPRCMVELAELNTIRNQ